jgi:hypothetical protein
MTKHRLLAVALASALALSAVACSSDSEPTPDKASYIKAADKLCKASDATINKLSDGISDTSSKKVKEAFYEKAATASLDNISAVRALGYPKGDKPVLDKAFKKFEDAFQVIKDDPSKFDSVTKARSQQFNAASKALDDYGFKECGTSG